MHPKSPANRLSGTHGAKILPGRTPFRCTDPSNHARRANVTIRRSAKPPERPRPRRRHRSSPTPASSLSPRRTTLSSPTAPPVETASTPPPPRRFANLRSPKGRATFPACGACLLCALGRCDRLINARRSPFYAIISLWLRKNRHPSGKTQALPIQWVGCSRGHVPYRTINKEKRLRWQLLHIALSARKRRKW